MRASGLWKTKDFGSPSSASTCTSSQMHGYPYVWVFWQCELWDYCILGTCTQMRCTGPRAYAIMKWEVQVMMIRLVYSEKAVGLTHWNCDPLQPTLGFQQFVHMLCYYLHKKHNTLALCYYHPNCHLSQCLVVCLVIPLVPLFDNKCKWFSSLFVPQLALCVWKICNGLTTNRAH